MKSPIFKTFILVCLLSFALYSCKKKPETTPAPAAADYRDNFTGKYAVTFTITGGSPSKSETQYDTVTVRIAQPGEKVFMQESASTASAVTITDLPLLSDGTLCIHIDANGKGQTGAAHMTTVDLSNQKFMFYFNYMSGSQSKTIYGAGVKIP